MARSTDNHAYISRPTDKHAPLRFNCFGQALANAGGEALGGRTESLHVRVSTWNMEGLQALPTDLAPLLRLQPPVGRTEAAWVDEGAPPDVLVLGLQSVAFAPDDAAEMLRAELRRLVRTDRHRLRAMSTPAGIP